MKKFWLLAVVLLASMEIKAQCNITTTTLPGGIVGRPYIGQITGSCGNKGQFNRLAGYPPLGLNISGTYGTISGTPALAGKYYFQMQLKGTGGTAVQDFWLTVVNPLVATGGPIVIPCGQNLNIQLPATGGWPPYSWTMTSGVLPPGLQFLSPSGTLVGNVDCSLKGQMYSIAVTVTDSGYLPMVATLILDFKM